MNSPAQSSPDTRPELPTLLIAEDSPVQAELLRRTIETAGYPVLMAPDGAEALELARVRRPSLIISDVTMPRMDGYQLCQAIRADTALAQTPFILLTMMQDPRDVIFGLNAGADAYVTKPYDANVLMRQIAALLEETPPARPVVLESTVLIDGARHRVHVTGDRALRLLVSTYESAVLQNRDLIATQSALTALNEHLEDRVNERTTALQASLAEVQAMNVALESAQNQLLQADKMASIGLLAAGVAHEINNPIGFVASNLNTLRDYTDDLLHLTDTCSLTAGDKRGCALRFQAIREEIDLDFLRHDMLKLLDECHEGITRIANIVRDLKDFSRVDSDTYEMADLNAAIDTTLKVIRHHLGADIAIVRDYAPLPPVRCMLGRVNQVMVNLLLNAVQAISGQGTITLRTRRDGDWVEITVSDTGCGIPPEHLRKIFDPFFTTKPVGSGTGLGLSLSYDIIKKHGGELRVDSVVGKGSDFHVRLPLGGAP